MRCRWASSVIDCRVSNVAQTGSEHDSAKLDTEEFQIFALKHLRLALRNRSEGKQLEEDAPPPEYEWRALKDTVADVS